MLTVMPVIHYINQSLGHTVAALNLRWHRFLRFGLKTPNARISAKYVLAHWFALLVLLHAVLWVFSFSTRPLFRVGSVLLPTDTNVELKSFWTDRHLIFAVSGGRSGSAYLSSVLACSQDIVSLHEPSPQMTGDDLQDVLLHGRRKETFADRSRGKIRSIRNTLMGTHQNVVYAETSHMFIKTFADVILNELANLEHTRISILTLARNPADVILSQLRLGWFSANHSGRNFWYYVPQDLHPSEQKLNASSFDTDPLSAATLYNADIAMRLTELARLVEWKHTNGEWLGVRIYPVSLKEIHPDNHDGIRLFLQRLSLKPQDDRISNLRFSNANSRDIKKVIAHVRLNEAQVRKQVKQSWKQLLNLDSDAVSG